MTPHRTLLRRSRTILGSDASFLTPDGVDVDSTQNYEVVRRKVFFDDVYLVTLHRERGIGFLVVNGLFAAFFLGIAILILAVNSKSWPWATPFLAIGLLFLIAFAIRLAVGRNIVTVFGRRSKAVMRFRPFQTQASRDVYGQICAAVRRAQHVPAAPAAMETPAP